jgi:thiosulfate/3-mercaptopyruvate sulfurtransferase
MRIFHPRTLAAICIALSLGAAPRLPQSADFPRISPAELVKVLQAPKPQQPLVIQIGFRVMYQQAHTPGSEYIGPTNTAAAIDQLRQRVQPLGHDTFIVLYCGCCPWDHCPNVAPAAKALAAMGFKNVKLLYIANDFGTDWVSKGYPVQKGG